MKMKKFDYKLPNEEKKKKKKIVFVMSVLLVIITLTLINSFAYYQSIAEQNAYDSTVGDFGSGDLKLSATINGVKSATIPGSLEGYYVSDITCSNGAAGSWDDVKWAIVVENLKQSGTTCDITFVTGIPSIAPLSMKILAPFGGVEAIQEAPVGTFANISESNEAVMYKIEDDYGDSYYYRGAKDLLNNNIIFAEHQWKIIRINGNGTYRLIYNGTCPNNSCIINGTGTATGAGGTYWGSSGMTSAVNVTYASNNIRNSVNGWYTNNIENQGTRITDKISDTLFCNDKREAVGSSIEKYPKIYMPNERLNVNKTPTLMCGNKDDKFTLSDTLMGNGMLNKPVGLISADEVALAGLMFGSGNNTNYLYTDQEYWTMSPYGTINDNSGPNNVTSLKIIVNRTGMMGEQWGYSSIRPVINLNANTYVTGNGSVANPFIVV